MLFHRKNKRLPEQKNEAIEKLWRYLQSKAIVTCDFDCHVNKIITFVDDLRTESSLTRYYKCWRCKGDKWYRIEELETFKSDSSHIDYNCPKCGTVVICSNSLIGESYD